MAGILFVLYIPKDSIDINVAGEGKRNAKGAAAYLQSEFQFTDSKHDENVSDNEGIDSHSGVHNSTNVNVREPLLQKSSQENTEVKFEIEEASTKKGHPSMMDSPEYFTLEEAVQQLIIKLGIDNDVWRTTDDNNSWQISFVISHNKCDIVLKRLISCGLGSIPETSISMFPSNYHLVSTDKRNKDKVISNEASLETSEEFRKKLHDEKKQFIKSIKSKLTVAQVVEGVKANSRLTFDYIALIILASIIASIGLAENSSVVLVASMLVSPIMGPILGGTFGYVIGNRELFILGIKNELLGLTLCLFCGLFSGIISSLVYTDGANGSSSDAWPTAEMQGRGLLRGLGVGVAIALPSGAGVALSILGGNTGSLVGVAISASLLPPAVNAGMLWAHAIISAIRSPSTIDSISTVVDQTTLSTVTKAYISSEEKNYATAHCLALKNNDYEFVYSCTMAKEAAILGIVSIFLTLLNIICIIVMGVIVLKIKEVAPNTAESKAIAQFWKNDISVAREIYKTVKGNERMDMAKLAKEIVAESKFKKFVSPNRRTRSHEDLAMYFRQFSIEEETMFGNLFEETDDGQQYFTAHNKLSLSPSEFNFLAPKMIDSTEPIEAVSTAKKAFVYEYPAIARPQKNNRTLKGFGRMNSCPENVIMKPMQTTTGKSGRFRVTAIPEEEHEAEQDRRASLISTDIKQHIDL